MGLCLCCFLFEGWFSRLTAGFLAGGGYMLVPLTSLVLFTCCWNFWVEFVWVLIVWFRFLTSGLGILFFGCSALVRFVAG